MKLFESIRKRYDEATPGEYETRCREFSNFAPLEVWTELGWADQLPTICRTPTYELFAHSRTDIPTLLEALDAAVEALEQVNCACLVEERLSGHLTGCYAIAKDEALKKIEELSEAVKGDG